MMNTSSNDLPKFFRIHRYHLEMNFYNLHESNHKKAEKHFKGYEAEVEMSRK